ncbi:YceG-like family [Mycobacteroides abscessus subsp. abscessus]|nr:YceG-like family [Mycobacteroides abscessus subsp. abscessus]
MKKQSLRSFAIGMLLSASMLGSYYFYQESKSQEQFSINVPDATTFLQKEGFIILSDSEYNDMQKTIEQSKQDQAKSDVEANEKKQEESKEEKQEIYSYTLKVKSGMSISSIAELLYENKIIKDPKNLETYLIDNDYHKKIQVGSFRLTSEMSNKKIAEKLTK